MRGTKNGQNKNFSRHYTTNKWFKSTLLSFWAIIDKSEFLFRRKRHKKLYFWPKWLFRHQKRQTLMFWKIHLEHLASWRRSFVKKSSKSDARFLDYAVERKNRWTSVKAVRPKTWDILPFLQPFSFNSLHKVISQT